MPKSKPSKKSVRDTTGPLSLAQARALATPVTKSNASPRRALAVASEKRAITPQEAMGAERTRRHLLQKQSEKQRIQEYKATLSLLKKRGVAGLHPAERKGPRRAPGAPTARSGPLQILAEGDSWFDYPVPLFGGGVIPRLEDRLGVPILNIAKAGDEVRFMMGVEQRTAMARRLRGGCPAGGPWDVLLFSGGGNDIVDNPMALWIRDFDQASSPAQHIHQSRYDAALALVRSGYEDLITMRDQLSPGTHLVFHAYDFAIPDGRGICHLGPWLKPTFDVRGYPTTSNVRFLVVKEMLQQFARMVQSIADTNDDVTFINTQGTLAPQASSWHNELHPSKGGFNAIADLFHTKLRALFPGRVL